MNYGLVLPGMDARPLAELGQNVLQPPPEALDRINAEFMK